MLTKNLVKLLCSGILISILLFGIGYKSFAQETKKENVVKSLLETTSISGLYYMGYYYDTKKEVQNFSLKRGYFTLKTNLNDVFSVRYTQDITTDKEGSDAGNVEMRLKYLYLKAKMDHIPFLKNSYFEVGMVHRPWLELEQHINQYRVQGKMYVERYDIIGSADFGITYIGLFGGKMDAKYRKEVNNKEAGRYGSFAIGFFNGGGYHAVENNSNKTFESRITIRPLPDVIPGVQFSHGFAYGKGNIVDPAPDFMMNVFMLSSESKYHKLTGEYYFGKGNDSGSYKNANNVALASDGYSIFGELFIPKTKFSLFSRYDFFNLKDDNNYVEKTLINGITYRFLKNKILLDYQRSVLPDETIGYYELALDISF